MRTRISLFTVPFLVLCTFIVATAQTAGTTETYTDGARTLQWVRTGDDYTGTFSHGPVHFQIAARQQGDVVNGTYVYQGRELTFIASIRGNTMTLISNNQTFFLTRQQPGANASDATPPQPAAPAPTASSAGEPSPTPAPAATPAQQTLPPGYVSVATSGSGQTLSVRKTGQTSVQAALDATFKDLIQYFRSQISIGSAYQSAQDSLSGGATFSSTWNGRPVKGIVSCKLENGVAKIAVVFARADSTKADWNQLTSPSPAANPQSLQTPPPGGPQQSNSAPTNPVITPVDVSNVPMHQYTFPDNSATIQIPDGWTCNAQTAVHGYSVKGPDGQVYCIGQQLPVSLPGGGYQPNAGGFNGGFPPPRPQTPLTAPYTDPVDDFQIIFAQLGRLSAAQNGPSFTLDKIIFNQDVQAHFSPDGKAASIVFDFTKTTDGQSVQMREALNIETDPPKPMMPGIWVAVCNFGQAPRASFDRDYALFDAIGRSFKHNMEATRATINAEDQALDRQTTASLNQINQQGQADLASQRASQQQFQGQMTATHDAQMQASQERFDREKAQWAQHETQIQQANADVIEQIQGTRAIVDTQTGQTGSAPLWDVNGVVDSLNQAALDPNRYVAVPLRNYFYAPTPVPGQ
jgi:hypothetical protein